MAKANDSGCWLEDNTTPNRSSKDEFSIDETAECSLVETPKGSESFGANSQSTEDNEKARYNSGSCVKKVIVNFKGMTVDCLTDGKETIIQMLEKYCPPTLKQTMKKSYMVFTRLPKPNGCVINLGLPTALLDDKANYECSFHPKRIENQPLYAKMRTFYVKKYENWWNVKFFYISVHKGRRGQPDIGDIKDMANIIQIAYFPKETLYEAMFRDSRLKIRNEKDELAIKKWYFKRDDDVVVELFNKAQPYSDTNFSLHWRKDKDKRLPDDVRPLPEPNYIGTGIKSETSSASLHHDYVNIYNEESDAQATMPSMSIKYHISTTDDLRKCIKDIYGVDVKKQEDKREERARISKIKQIFKDNYDKFALNYKHQIFTCDMKNLMEMSDSVGAVVVKYESNMEEFVGTCFVIGSRFVITNKHVLLATKNAVGFRDFYVDFDFGNHDDANKTQYQFHHEPVVSSSQHGELDYAILRLRNSTNNKPLPPSLSKCGYVIPSSGRSLDAGKFLTLIGHPAGLKKATDVTCPVRHPENLSMDIVLGFSQKDQSILCDQRRQLYDTSTFFYGSSGSPGVLIKERLLMVLHRGGFHLEDPNNSVIEQGIKMSAILADVNYKIKQGILPGLTQKDIFDIDEMEPMETD